MIRAAHYEAVVRELMGTKVIQDMEREIPAGMDLDAPDFSLLALREFNRRGGAQTTNPMHIGGPAEAIRALRGQK